jgi:hypothetical protein
MYAIATMCRVLEVSTNGYYAWRKWPPVVSIDVASEEYGFRR